MCSSDLTVEQFLRVRITDYYLIDVYQVELEEMKKKGKTKKVPLIIDQQRICEKVFVLKTRALNGGAIPKSPHYRLLFDRCVSG